MTIKPKFLLVGIACLGTVFWWVSSPLSTGQTLNLFAEFLERQAATTQIAPASKEPGWEAVFAIAGLLAVAYLILRQRK